ncbi:hypothetical protein SE18_20735 [Herpetosiphon geysericola]|uniref:Uncharacterized protein n=1 Tax=Herpetosiphon geysericola TaxID=70996 RepID=A0A0P6YHC5_9CHLR|nr:hypothetical protein SE18_20735 [Herpetosiphon geysericola]
MPPSVNTRKHYPASQILNFLLKKAQPSSILWSVVDYRPTWLEIKEPIGLLIKSIELDLAGSEPALGLHVTDDHKIARNSPIFLWYG